MAMNGFSAFLKAPASLEHIVSCHIQYTRWGGVVHLCKGAVGLFYSPTQLGNTLSQNRFISDNSVQHLVHNLDVKQFYFRQFKLTKIRSLIAKNSKLKKPRFSSI